MTESYKVRGLAAVFDEWAPIGDFDERIRRGAFTRTLKENADILALHSHDPALVLGRSPSTLLLWESQRGLEFDLTLDHVSSIGRTVHSGITRGDLKQMSFGFFVRDDDWETTGERLRRTINDVDLLEISTVAWPAYKNTSVILAHAGSSAKTASNLRRYQLRVDQFKRLK